MDVSEELRKRMIIKLIEALKQSPKFINIPNSKLKEAVLNSELQTFESSKNRDQYIYYINEKLKKIFNNSSYVPQRPSPSFDSSNHRFYNIPTPDSPVPTVPNMSTRENFMMKNNYSGLVSHENDCQLFNYKNSQSDQQLFSKNSNLQSRNGEDVLNNNTINRHKLNNGHESDIRYVRFSMNSSTDSITPAINRKINYENNYSNISEQDHLFNDFRQPSRKYEEMFDEYGRDFNRNRNTSNWVPTQTQCNTYMNEPNLNQNYQDTVSKSQFFYGAGAQQRNNIHTTKINNMNSNINMHNERNKVPYIQTTDDCVYKEPMIIHDEYLNRPEMWGNKINKRNDLRNTSAGRTSTQIKLNSTYKQQAPDHTGSLSYNQHNKVNEGNQNIHRIVNNGRNKFQERQRPIGNGENQYFYTNNELNTLWSIKEDTLNDVGKPSLTSEVSNLGDINVNNSSITRAEYTGTKNDISAEDSKEFLSREDKNNYDELNTVNSEENSKSQKSSCESDKILELAMSYEDYISNGYAINSKKRTKGPNNAIFKPIIKETDEVPKIIPIPETTPQMFNSNRSKNADIAISKELFSSIDSDVFLRNQR